MSKSVLSLYFYFSFDFSIQTSKSFDHIVKIINFLNFFIIKDITKTLIYKRNFFENYHFKYEIKVLKKCVQKKSNDK